MAEFIRAQIFGTTFEITSRYGPFTRTIPFPFPRQIQVYKTPILAPTQHRIIYSRVNMLLSFSDTRTYSP